MLFGGLFCCLMAQVFSTCNNRRLIEHYSYVNLKPNSSDEVEYWYPVLCLRSTLVFDASETMENPNECITDVMENHVFIKRFELNLTETIIKKAHPIDGVLSHMEVMMYVTFQFKWTLLAFLKKTLYLFQGKTKLAQFEISVFPFPDREFWTNRPRTSTHSKLLSQRVSW